MTTKSKKSSKMNVTEAKKIIDAERKAVAEKCAKEIQEAIESISKKHNCTFSIMGEFSGNNIKTGFSIIPNETQAQ
jgi:hypothetical protein